MNFAWHIRKQLFKIGLKSLKASGWYDGYWNQWRGAPFQEAERQGLHILPVHYYSPVPNVAALPDLWSDAPFGAHLDLKLETALDLCRDLVGTYGEKFNQLATGEDRGPQRFRMGNPAYHAGEAECLYGLVRHFKPKRIIEIGSGHSSLVTAEALRDARAEDGHTCKYTCVEPYPPEYLSPLPDGIDEILAEPVQSVPLSLFDTLEANDILFIDSTHVVQINSDVLREFLEILPRLKPGVIVHVHDIFLPYEYPRTWIDHQRFFWNEQYLLAAFLMFNPAFEVVLPTYVLSRDRATEFQDLFPTVAAAKQPPSAFWLRRV